MHDFVILMQCKPEHRRIKGVSNSRGMSLLVRLTGSSAFPGPAAIVNVDNKAICTMISDMIQPEEVSFETSSLTFTAKCKDNAELIPMSTKIGILI